MLNAVKDWLISLVVNFILDQIKSGAVKGMAERLQCTIQPVIQSWKAEVIQRLKAEAAQTKDTKLDDAIVEAVDVFLSALVNAGSSQCKVPVSK